MASCRRISNLLNYATRWLARHPREKTCSIRLAPQDGHARYFLRSDRNGLALLSPQPSAPLA